jgi:ABC-type methionine transport system permease subunit
MKLDHKLRAVSMVLQTACDFVIAFVSTAAAPAYGEPEAVTLLATLWSQKMHQRELSFDAELANHVRSFPSVFLFISFLSISPVHFSNLARSISSVIPRPPIATMS